MSEVYVDDPCLLYATGIVSLDLPDLLTSYELSADNVFAVSRAQDGVFHGLNLSGNMIADHSGPPNADLPTHTRLFENEQAVARAALRAGVTWVAPTPHCKDTYELARIAEHMDANYPSSPLVYRIEDKPTFYGTIGGDERVPVPESRACVTGDEIEKAVIEIGRSCVIKTSNGHSSLALKTIDGSRPLTEEDRRTIAEHVEARNKKGITETVVQEAVGPDEFGLQALIEVSDAGIHIPWSVSTRKIIIPPFGRLSAHIFDPADMERVELTEDLLLPTLQVALERLLDGTPDIMRSRVGRYALNCDFRTDLSKAWWIDGSFRWAPRFQQLGNAALGEFALSGVMPQIAKLWAQGKPVDARLLAPDPDKPQRAVIMRKAYTAIGGTVVQLAESEEFLPFSIFFGQVPEAGKVLPGPQEDSSEAAIGEFPLMCVDGKDITDAEANWREALRLSSVAVERDGVLYGPESLMAA